MFPESVTHIDTREAVNAEGDGVGVPIVPLSAAEVVDLLRDPGTVLNWS